MKSDDLFEHLTEGDVLLVRTSTSAVGDLNEVKPLKT